MITYPYSYLPLKSQMPKLHFSLYYCRVLPLLNRELARVSTVSAELSIKQPAVA